MYEFAKFGVIGVAGLFITNAVYGLFFLDLGAGPVTSTTIATTVAAVATYLGNRYWSFRARQRTGVPRELIVFAVLNGAGVLIQDAAVAFNYYLLQLGHNKLAGFVALNSGIALAALFRFWSYRRFVWVAPLPDGAGHAEGWPWPPGRPSPTGAHTDRGGSRPPSRSRRGEDDRTCSPTAPDAPRAHRGPRRAVGDLALGSADHPVLSGCPDPPAGPWRDRWAFWRSPPGQPAWARPALLGIAAAAAALYARNLPGAGFAPIYSTAVKSMSLSWKAFFYGAYDPAATITLDKLAGSFLPQALSARIFGFHPWSLALPQVAEGVIAVLVMYRVARRWAGVMPGLLAAGIFAFTPVVASMSGHSMEDAALTMCLVLAADCWQRAVGGARLGSLMWAGVWVGAGFQAKMLQAWMILPALALGYLVAAPARLGRRLWHLAAAGGVMLAVSLSWIALYTLTPATSRPYVDGSTGNSAIAMVFGYNGLERFDVRVPGAITIGPGVMVGTGGGDGAALFGGRFGPEIGWLYPVALLALAAGLVAWRRAPRADPVRAGFLMWGAWLAVFGVVFSEMSLVMHTAYVASLAPPLAALSGAGIVMFCRWHRAGDRRGLLLPLAVAAGVAWAARLWAYFPGFLPWARWTVIMAGAAAAVALAAAWPSQRRHRGQPEAAGPSARAGAGAGARPAIAGRLAAAGLAAGIAAMLAAPATWALSVLDPVYAGSSFDAIAGPGGTGAAPAGPFGVTATLDDAQKRIYGYLSAHRSGARYLMAAQTQLDASPYIVATGQEVLSLGGFTGFAPEPTLARFQQLAGSGQLRFFLVGTHARGAGRFSGTELHKITSWVERSCRTIPAGDYGGASATARASPAGGRAGTLYDCGTNR